VDGIQVNFCKNPVCANYGIPASSTKQPRGPGAALKGRDSYTLLGSGKSAPMMRCHECGEYPTLKSNQGIADEVKRISSYFNRDEPSCPNAACINHKISIESGKVYYSAFGKTSGGSQRFKCKSCNKVFTVRKSTAGQRLPHKNKVVFSLLMNKVPFNRICEVADINPKTLYDKIRFLHRQCLLFVADRESRLLNRLPIRRLYVSVDRQEYTVNWTKRADKRNTMLFAVGSADNKTGYVFGMHLNYDPGLDSDAIESDAIVSGDYSTSIPFRKYAQLWLQEDYDDAVKHSMSRRITTGLNDQIVGEYNEAINRADVERSEHTSATRRLPARGMQVHSEYTLYGHFYFLHNLFGGAEKVRFFLDQDSGMRAACFAAFQPEVKARTCDAFYVRINKEMTVDEKRRALADSRKVFQQVQREHPDLSENELRLMLIKQRMDSMTEIGKWKDRWLIHPFPNMSEPEKASCYLTDYGDYDEDHRAWLYNKASMHAIDCFFMQVRRRLSLLERPISSASGTGRRWFGYSAYNPESLVNTLDIFRVFYNYCLAGKDKQTPAMRIGLAKGAVRLEDIIYHSST
jgi:transposase-like protein